MSAEPSAPAEPPASAEPPKRRSTVREPAPMFSSGAMSDVQPSPGREAPPPAPPAPQPVAMPEPAAPAAEEGKRRFGWWSKRG
jgi:ribonuclease E